MTLLLSLMGSIALLLWGIRMVRTGIVRAFGTDLRRFISRHVTNRIVAVLSGAGITCLLQSSTATAVMTATFTSRGIMSAPVAMAILLGADVGTTLVAQVMSLNVEWLSPLLLTTGVVLHFASKSSSIKQIARAAIGLGVVLLSLKLLGQLMEPLRSSQVAIELISLLADETVIIILLAAIITWATHSSLAVVLALSPMVMNEVIPLSTAFYMVLGINIGGVVPSITATLSEGIIAKRITVSNLAFKILLAIIVIPFIDIIQPLLISSSDDYGRVLLNFHTLFNLIILSIFIFLLTPAASLARVIFPDPEKKVNPGDPVYLDFKVMDVPSLALSSAARESLRMAEYAETMIKDAIKSLNERDLALAAKVMSTDDYVDHLHEAIKLYVTKINRSNMNHSESRRVMEILNFSTNLEHIGDISENLAEKSQKKARKKLKFSEEGLVDINQLHDYVVESLNLAVGMFMSNDINAAKKIISGKNKIKIFEREAAEKHLRRLQEGCEESRETSALHLDILSDLKRISSHIVDMAYPVKDRWDNPEPGDEAELSEITE